MIKRILFLYILLTLSVSAMAQKEDVLFFNEVDTAFQKVYVGQDTEVGYYSTQSFENLSTPQWHSCGAEQISGPHKTSSSRVSIVSGKKERLSLKGVYYIVRFKKPGWVTLPIVTALFDGENKPCTSMKVLVLPIKNEKEAVCTLTTEPEIIQPDKVFRLVLTCNRRPDESKPLMEHPGINLLSTSTGYTKQNGKEEYKFIYMMKIINPGSHTIWTKKLTFGGVGYSISPYILKIEGETFL